MLCDRHNNALSDIDQLAHKFFSFLRFPSEDDDVEVELIRGYDLERWVLKTFIGLVASGNVMINGHRQKTWEPPKPW